MHLGKHGNLEWLPGKTLGMSAACGTDAALGDLPLIYPFLVNDPGEGTQAKRRAHATLVDHLIPPMARAETYGDIARLEQLLDEHANVAAMDPAKLPAIRAADLDADPGRQDGPRPRAWPSGPTTTSSTTCILHVDGWLCEIKDVQIRDGLHVLGPARGARPNSTWCWPSCGPASCSAASTSLPGLREALGLGRGRHRRTRRRSTRPRPQARALVAALQAAGWDPRRRRAAHRRRRRSRRCCGSRPPRWCRGWPAPPTRSTQVLHALDGGFIPAGPSGSPLRGLVNVLPTGRNFYSVDPKAIPSRLAWETGLAMADSLLERYRNDTGD